MLTRSLLLGGALLTTGFSATAQTILPAPGRPAAPLPDATPAAPRYYVGLGVVSNLYQARNQEAARYGRGHFLVPLQLTAGYQLRPRLGVHLSLAYGRITNHYAYAGRVYGNSPEGYTDFREDLTAHQVDVSVLARYTLTRNAGHRLQFDALGGLTLAYGRSFNRGTQTDSLGGAPRTLSFASHPTQLDLLLTAGVGMRYRLSPRFELFYDLTLNRALTGPPRPFSLGNAGSQALGLRFRFGH